MAPDDITSKTLDFTNKRVAVLTSDTTELKGASLRVNEKLKAQCSIAFGDGLKVEITDSRIRRIIVRVIDRITGWIERPAGCYEAP